MPTLDLPDGPITYSERGAGPPVVLVHGVLVDERLWRDVIPLLADSFRVIALGLPLGAHARPVPPGTDLTPPAQARRIAQALEALDLHDVCLVGNDTGGGICQLVAAWHPERLDRLVLTNCDAYDAFPPTVVQPVCALARRRPALADLLVRGLRFGAGRTLLAAPVLSRRDPALLRAWMAPSGTDAGLRGDVVRVLAGLHPRHHREALPGLRAFARPVLLAWAPGDLLFPMRLAERLAADLPDARIVRLARGRAFSPLEQPERVAAAIATFAGAGAQARSSRELAHEAG